MFMSRKNQYWENGYNIKELYKSIMIPIKCPMPFFTEIEKS
jgi:hypothetical protein